MELLSKSLFLYSLRKSRTPEVSQGLQHTPTGLAQFFVYKHILIHIVCTFRMILKFWGKCQILDTNNISAWILVYKTSESYYNNRNIFCKKYVLCDGKNLSPWNQLDFTFNSVNSKYLLDKNCSYVLKKK